jgi:hypothetical protein
MEQGLGRLGFAANALTWERPFLGPLYSWTAAIRNKTGVLRIPTMLRTILWFLADRTAEGGSLQAPPPLKEGKDDNVIFYTDAKATEKGAWVGGFLQTSDGQIGEWFCFFLRSRYGFIFKEQSHSFICGYVPLCTE